MGSNPRPGRTIGDHGVVGDLDTLALVARDGTVDFMCWPHLDSPSIFAALLDPDNGGEFTIAPTLEKARTSQIYVPDTNVLTTRWVSHNGSAEVVDLMPHPSIQVGLHRCLVRRVCATRGTVAFEVRCRPRLDYARRVPTVEADGQGVVFADGGAPVLKLTSSRPLATGDGEATSRFELAAGEQAWFVLGRPDDAPPNDADVADALARTVTAWREWVRRSTYRGRWREMVNRSALALKLLTSCEHGSISAAATFGLPEASEGGRNWDYRATWIRDASFTVYSFMRLGYQEEAEAFRHWVGKRVSEANDGGRLRVMYALDGSDAAPEQDLDYLAGYGGARPVRVGNAAAKQLQLDIYGELLDSIYLSNKYGAAISQQGWLHVKEMVDYVRHNWRRPDEGIWEIRDHPREFLHSRVMCWVALDRAIRLARKRSLPAPLVVWSRERDRIAADIWENFRHPEHGYFVQTRGGRELDASLLMLPLVRFVSATDPVWLKTLDAIGDQLADDGLVFRYRNSDGLPSGEGAFTACTFWFIECLARADRVDEAHVMMERALRYANPLGLYSEELSPTGDPLGNFPQALTHLAFISAAYFLARKLDRTTEALWQP